VPSQEAARAKEDRPKKLPLRVHEDVADAVIGPTLMRGKVWIHISVRHRRVTSDPSDSALDHKGRPRLLPSCWVRRKIRHGFAWYS